MAATFIKLNGVDWSALCSEIVPIIREIKKTETNVKGEVQVLSGRTKKLTSSVQLTFPYVPLTEMTILEGLATTGTPITLEHNIDLPQGSMDVVEYNKQVVKVLDSVAYTIVLLLTEHTTTGVPGNSTGLSPANPNTFSAASITQKLGL